MWWTVVSVTLLARSLWFDISDYVSITHMMDPDRLLPEGTLSHQRYVGTIGSLSHFLALHS